MFQLYHGDVSWVIIQYYWSIYPNTSESVIMLTPTALSAKVGLSYYFNFFKSLVRPNWGSNPRPHTRGYALSLHHRGILVSFITSQIKCSITLSLIRQFCSRRLWTYFVKKWKISNWMDNLWLKVENIVAKGEIACFEQFLLLSLCFQKAFCCRGVRKHLNEGKS